MTKFIIGAVSESDMPLTPAAKGSRSMTAYLTNYTYEDTQRERNQMLDATSEDIRALAGYLEAFLADDCLCVVGNEERIREEKDKFMKIENLF